MDKGALVPIKIKIKIKIPYNIIGCVYEGGVGDIEAVKLPVPPTNATFIELQTRNGGFASPPDY